MVGLPQATPLNNMAQNPVFPNTQTVTGQGIAQGLPPAIPAGGFTPTEGHNQFGTWGRAAEKEGIPGTTDTLPQTGITPGPFNPGDVVKPQAPPPPNAPDVPGAPPPVKPKPTPAASTSATTTSAPPPPKPAPPPPNVNPNAGMESMGYALINGQQVYSPFIAQQQMNAWNTANPGAASGGAIPTYDEGGNVFPMDSEQGQEGQAGDPMVGVRKAVSMARQSFGLSDNAFQGLFQGGAQTAAPVAPQSQGPANG
jgi:hypothetical protein